MLSKGTRSRVADIYRSIFDLLGAEDHHEREISACARSILTGFSDHTSFPDNASYADLNSVLRAAVVYKKFSVYPFIVRDIAVFTPEDVAAEEVWATVLAGIKESNAENLLVRHALFDTFKKDGKVSYAFRMVFQSAEKTLTDEEINAVMEKIYTDIKAKNWEVR